MYLIDQAPHHKDVWWSGGTAPLLLTSASDRVEWSTSRSDHFTAGKDPQCPLDTSLRGSQSPNYTLEK
jgi:hypothetical protein